MVRRRRVKRIPTHCVTALHFVLLAEQVERHHICVAPARYHLKACVRDVPSPEHCRPGGWPQHNAHACRTLCPEACAATQEIDVRAR